MLRGRFLHPTMVRLMGLGNVLWRDGGSAARVELVRIARKPWRSWRRCSLARVERRLRFQAVERPRVTIVIPVFNEWLRTYNCLLSLEEASSTVPFEVVVVDDASTDRTAAMLQKVDNIRVVRLAVNRGFLEACNQGVRESRGREILFLNNDTKVTNGWLDGLVRTLDEYPDCGVVGPRLLFPNGLLQEAGGIVWRDSTATNYGKFDDPDKPQYATLREVDYVSGAALLVRSEVLGEGFDPRFSPGYWEDVDLAFRTRQLGYRVLYQPASEVFHFEGASNWSGAADSAGLQRDSNRPVFQQKWSTELARQWPRTRRNLHLASDRRLRP